MPGGVFQDGKRRGFMLHRLTGLRGRVPPLEWLRHHNVRLYVPWNDGEWNENTGEEGLAMLIGDGLFADYVLWAAGRTMGTPIGLVLASLVNPIGAVQQVMAGRRILRQPMCRLGVFFRGPK